jgi:hypothetical protein
MTTALKRGLAQLHTDSNNANIKPAKLTSSVPCVFYSDTTSKWLAKRRINNVYVFQRTFDSRQSAEAFVAGFDQGMEMAGRAIFE